MIFFFANPHNVSAARTDFFEVGERLRVQAIRRCHHDRCEFFVDESDGAVLELPCCVTLGMAVGDFFELECSFERNGIHGAAPNKKNGFHALQ